MAVARSRTRIVFTSALVIVVGVACGIDAVGTGATPDGDVNGASTSSGGASSGATSSGGSSSGDVADGATDAADPDACVPSAEVCDDGLDNDCNGKTDCEDPACTDYACTTGETDWSMVSVRAATAGNGGVDAGAPSCAAGWTNGRTLLDNVRSSADSCACTCGDATGNPCANGTRVVSFRTGTESCNDGNFTMNLDGACRSLPFIWVSANGADVQPPANIVQVSCDATATKPAVVDDGALVVCDKATTGTATTCTNGTCVRKPGTDKICLMRAGDAHACPAAYPARKVVAPSYDDGRTCNACSCTTNATACSSRQMSFYTNAGCTQGKRTVVADNTCNAASGSGNPSHYRYEATPNGGCVAASATVGIAGAVTLTTPSTLCCAQ